tara:strand:- start:501 stop:1121 length:621 start_codon:yes stop_codon:yes gene_type:complete
MSKIDIGDKLKIIENFIEKDQIHQLNRYFLYNTPHIWGHRSVDDGNQFYSAKEEDFKCDLTDYVKEKIHDRLESEYNCTAKMLRPYINIQHTGMDGNFHYDDVYDKNVVTTLLFVSNTMKTGGEFQYMLNNYSIANVQFVQNRLIMFKMPLEHRGLAPVARNEIWRSPRISFAVKFELDNPDAELSRSEGDNVVPMIRSTDVDDIA